MNSEQLINALLKENKNEQFEFNESLNLRFVGSVICSFLNNNGGQILIGIDNKKEIVGVEHADRLKTQIERFLIKKIIPESPVMVSIEKHFDKDLILVKVWGGANQPYIFEGNIFYRRGNKTVKASSKEISTLIHERQNNELHWERRAVLGFEFEDLSLSEIQKTINKSVIENKMDKNNDKILDFLSHYGLFKNGNFTNACVILFATTPARFIPQSRIRVSFLNKGKTDDEFKANKILEGNLFKNIEGIISFLEENLSNISKFSKNDWERKDDFIYPMIALREGILNALIHRDYSNISGSISIIIYSDRLEISNIGKLSLDVSELEKNHLSMPVNPDIAHIAFLRGYIEKIGRGTLKIIDACKEAGLKAPKWTTDSNSVTLTFFNKSNKVEHKGFFESLIESTKDGFNQIKSNVAEKGGWIPAIIEANQEENKKALEEANKLATKKILEEENRKKTNDKVIEGVIEGVTEGVTEGVKEKIIILLNLIINYEGKRIPFYAEKISESDKNIERYIKQLKKFELIEYKGSSRTGGYFLTNKIKEKLK
ncbi:MAG: ATP-binding protein [Cyanobacteriota bacterium]